MNPRPLVLLIAAFTAPAVVLAQAPGHFPPDSLISVKVIPKSTPVMQVVGMMRNFTGALGVRCPFCHVGQEGQPRRGHVQYVPPRRLAPDAARAADHGDRPDVGGGLRDPRVPRATRALLWTRVLRFRGADAQHRRLPAGARGEV